MNIALLILGAIIVVCIYHGVQFVQKVSMSKVLVEKAEVFTLDSTDFSTTLLVLGDSTAVGVGADSKDDTVAALLAQKVGATYVENKAVSGATIADLKSQMASALRSEYSYILVAIGGNDIIRFHDVHGATESLREALQALPKTEKLILHSAGNVGASTLFPWFVRPFHTSLTISYHQAFTQVVRENGGTYVNLYLDPKVDPFTSEPHIYLSKDGLHPSSAGYKLWFESIVAHI